MYYTDTAAHIKQLNTYIQLTTSMLINLSPLFGTLFIHLRADITISYADRGSIQIATSAQIAADSQFSSYSATQLHC